MSWLNKLLPPKIKREQGPQRRGALPEGLWSKCPSCEAVLYASDLENNLQVCPKCGHHNRLGFARAAGSAARSGRQVRDRRRGRSGRQPEIQGFQALSGSSDGGQRGDRRERFAGCAAGRDQDHAGRCRRFRVRLHGRFDGLGAR